MQKIQSPASSVPRSRVKRLAHLGGLAGRVAGGMLAEGIRQVAQGNMPRASDLILTPANARRVADKLSELRGAAMKVGQLLSMDAGDILIMPAGVSHEMVGHSDDVMLTGGYPDGRDWDNIQKEFHRGNVPTVNELNNPIAVGPQAKRAEP